MATRQGSTNHEALISGSSSLTPFQIYCALMRDKDQLVGEEMFRANITLALAQSNSSDDLLVGCLILENSIATD